MQDYELQTTLLFHIVHKAIDAFIQYYGFVRPMNPCRYIHVWQQCTSADQPATRSSKGKIICEKNGLDKAMVNTMNAVVSTVKEQGKPLNMQLFGGA